MECKRANWAILSAAATLASVTILARESPAKNPPGHVYLSPASIGMVQFALSNLGKQVKNGGCAELVAEARKYARQPETPKAVPLKIVYEQDYINGKWVHHGTTHNIWPGDILCKDHVENGRLVSGHAGIVLTFGMCSILVTAQANVNGNKNVGLYTLESCRSRQRQGT